MKYVIGLVFCLFMGMTAISLGGGAVYPPINNVAKPVVCPDGEMTNTRTSTTTRRGKNRVSAAYACEDKSGEATPISSFTIALFAGSIYGLGLFVILAAILALKGSRARA